MAQNFACPSELLQEVAAQAERDTGAGLAAVETLLRSYPGDARLQFLKGSLLAALDRFGEALAPFADAVRLDPNFGLARFQMGLLQLTSGDVQGAGATWAPLQTLSPEDPLRLFSEGLQHLARDDFAAAERLLREGLARNTQLPALNRDMQLVLQQMTGSSAPQGEESYASSSAHLLLQLATKNTRH